MSGVLRNGLARLTVIVWTQLCIACAVPTLVISGNKDTLKRAADRLVPQSALRAKILFECDVPEWVDAFNSDPRGVGYRVRIPARAMFTSAVEEWSARRASLEVSGEPIRVSLRLAQVFYTRNTRKGFLHSSGLSIDADITIANQSDSGSRSERIAGEVNYSGAARMLQFRGYEEKLQAQYEQVTYESILILFDTIAEHVGAGCLPQSESC